MQQMGKTFKIKFPSLANVSKDNPSTDPLFYTQSQL
jgi:hypothetical protein